MDIFISGLNVQLGQVGWEKKKSDIIWSFSFQVEHVLDRAELPKLFSLFKENFLGCS